MNTFQTDYFKHLLVEEREQAAVKHEQDLIGAIDDALDQLHTDPERFGLCAKCGRPIDPDRLRIVPTARYCEDDAERRPFAYVGPDSAW